MCCCWLFPSQPTLRQFQSWWAQNNWKGPESQDYRGACEGYHDMETGPLWAVMSGSLQLSCSGSDQCKVTTGAASSIHQGGTVEVQKFWLNDVKGSVCTTQQVTIPPFGTVNIWANSSVKGYCMWVHILTEPALGPQLPAAVVPTATYGELHPGSSRVPVCLHNLSAHAMDVPTKTVAGQIVPANQVPLVVHPTRTSAETYYPAQKGWVLESLDLQGLKEWSESEQKQARELLLKWASVCTQQPGSGQNCSDQAQNNLNQSNAL